MTRWRWRCCWRAISPRSPMSPHGTSNPYRFSSGRRYASPICTRPLAGEGWGALRGIERLTAFADYKLPQMLRREGVLVYEPELAELIASYTLIPAGADAEVEIRAATIWAVELLRQALAQMGIQQTASAIDYRIWLESQDAPADGVPYHRTRTIYY